MFKWFGTIFSLGATELEMSRIKQTSFMRLAMVTHIPSDLYSRNEGRWANTKDVGRRRWGNCWSKQALDSRGGACCAQRGTTKALCWGTLKYPFHGRTMIRCCVQTERLLKTDLSLEKHLQAMQFTFLCLILLNKHHKLWPRERKHPVWPKLWTERHSVSVDLRFERRTTVYKHLEGLPDTCLSFTNLLLHLLSLTTWTHPNAIDTSKSLIGNDFSIKWTLESR